MQVTHLSKHQVTVTSVKTAVRRRDQSSLSGKSLLNHMQENILHLHPTHLSIYSAAHVVALATIIMFVPVSVADPIPAMCVLVKATLQVNVLLDGQNPSITLHLHQA